MPVSIFGYFRKMRETSFLRRVRDLILRLGRLLTMALFSIALCSSMSLSMVPSIPSAAHVGTIVTWKVSVSNADPGILWYRFRVRRIGSDLVGSEFRVIKDYGLDDTLDWTASDHEGTFEIEASVRNTTSGAVEVTTAPYSMLPNITGDQPVILPTTHPLVFLYSAPACSAPSRMRVLFQQKGGPLRTTPYTPCGAGLSMNFYVAGLLPGTEYLVRHTLDTGSATISGPELSFFSGLLAGDFPSQTVLQPTLPTAPDPILLHAAIFARPFATDLDGNVVWYYPGSLTFLTRPERDGHFYGIVQDPGGNPALQLVLAFDLTGMTLLETNAARVNEQLIDMGKRTISSFHHEARQLPGGKVLVLGSVEQVLIDSQGSSPVDVLGDMIIVLDRDLQVVWTWDTFDHMDPARRATLNEMCATSVCPPLRLAATAQDWTHASSVQQTPDGNLLLCIRNQDLVIKIDYQNGEGSGEIIWRLGKDGDFRFISTDPYPWFSHQHDAQFAPDNTTLLLVDNGNVRRDADPGATSRGQVIHVDERNRTATLLVNQDLGQYSFAMGSAQALPEGHYGFDIGYPPDSSAVSVEFDASGNRVYALQTPGPVYRSFRMPDMYSSEAYGSAAARVISNTPAVAVPAKR